MHHENPMKTAHRASLAEWNALFASLQHRASTEDA